MGFRNCMVDWITLMLLAIFAAAVIAVMLLLLAVSGCLVAGVVTGGSAFPPCIAAVTAAIASVFGQLPIIGAFIAGVFMMGVIYCLAAAGTRPALDDDGFNPLNPFVGDIAPIRTVTGVQAQTAMGETQQTLTAATSAFKDQQHIVWKVQKQCILAGIALCLSAMSIVIGLSQTALLPGFTVGLVLTIWFAYRLAIRCKTEIKRLRDEESALLIALANAAAAETLVITSCSKDEADLSKGILLAGKVPRIKF